MAIKVRRGKLFPPIELGQGLALGLDEIEWERIVDRLGRLPNHFECSIFAALWSESVSNKSSTSLLESIARQQPDVIQLPGSPLALIPIEQGTYLALRIVNNNTQSYFEPYYGAQTAFDHAITDLTNVGAVPLGVFDMLRFGSHEKIKNQHLFQGVVDGIAAYGNKFGVPVLGGELYFHERYNGGMMVNCAVAGIMQSEHPLNNTKVEVGCPVLYVGAATGRDGLRKQAQKGGEEMLLDRTARMEHLLTVSDPLLANRLVYAAAEAIERGVVRELVRVGVGGLAVSAFELSSRIGRPILLDINHVPLRVEGLEPLDIILSESSERVLLVVDKERHRDLNKILYKWDLESTKVGEVNDADGIEFYWNHYLAADIPFQFALGGSVQKSFDVVKFPPMLKRTAKMSDADKLRRRRRKVEDEWSLVREVQLGKEHEKEEREVYCPKDLEDVWLDMLANPNVCSRLPMYRQFDQVVGANTIQRPGGDAAVVRLRFLKDGDPLGTMFADESGYHTTARSANGSATQSGTIEKALALTLDSNSLYVMMEPYLGTVQTIAEGMRNLAAVGARPKGISYCMNFGDPDSYRDVCDLAESIRGMGDASKIWDIPILSRQICLFNGTEGNPTMPTPVMFMAGILEDFDKMCTAGFKSKGDLILLLGLTKNEIGCSEYSYYFHKYVNRLVPDIDFEKEKQTSELVVRLIEDRLLHSAHDLAAGGLATALTECCMNRPRPIGATFNIAPQVFETPNGPIHLRSDAALFSESSSRFLISCSPKNEETVRARCAEHGIAVTGTGVVGGSSMCIEGAAEVELPLSTSYKLWIHRLEILLGEGGEETVGF